jgi:phosphopantothenoylcysteine synthetase/decarboxylase
MAAHKILIGISGGIAVYKTCELVRLLRKEGHEVRVLMSRNAREFVTPLTFEVLSGNPVPAGMFSPRADQSVEHVEMATWCDLFALVPATANVIGKLASGIADDQLTTVTMAIPAAKPRILAPAMNVHMWENPILQRNLKLLSDPQGPAYRIVPPVEKELACGDVGMGGLAEVNDICAAVLKAMAAP